MAVFPMSRMTDSSLGIAHITDDIALQVGGAPLELRAGKHLADDVLQSPEPVCTDQTLGVECACKALALLLLVPEYANIRGWKLPYLSRGMRNVNVRP